jgi:hypothetical protein
MYLAELLFVTEAEWVGRVWRERRDAAEAGVFVEADRRMLVDAGFKAKRGDAVREGIG